MTTATDAGHPVDEHPDDQHADEATRRSTLLGMTLLLLMPLTIALMVTLVSLWLTAPLR